MLCVSVYLSVFVSCHNYVCVLCPCHYLIGVCTHMRIIMGNSSELRFPKLIVASYVFLSYTAVRHEEISLLAD